MSCCGTHRRPSFRAHLHHLARTGRTVCCGLVALCLLVGAACVLTSCQEKEIKNPVYLCNGSSAVCYHCDRDCEGLQMCGGSISKVSLEDARRDGRRPCHFCYGFGSEYNELVGDEDAIEDEISPEDDPEYYEIYDIGHP